MMYNITDYGAKGDGVTNDAAAIQKAVDECSAAGGGVVLLPGGKTYRSGSIILKSNVEFRIERGAVLKASDNKEDYMPLSEDGKIQSGEMSVPSYENCDYNGRPFQVFIYAFEQENIAITGFGTIDGNESIYYGNVTQYFIDGNYYPRIPLLCIEAVCHLTIKEVTLTGSGFWTTHLVGCEDVLIDGIRILNNMKLANCDGIDPDHCRNVRIANCYIACADDAIVFKTTQINEKYGPTENITVTNCILQSTSAAIKFGTESVGDFKNITVDNCVIEKTNRGISLQLRDCGNIENVSFSNLMIETRKFSKEYWGQAEPICITALKRNEDTIPGTIKNIRFSNIQCTGENGIFILGNTESIIKDVSFEHVRVKIKKTSKWAIEGYDMRPCMGEHYIRTKVAGAYMQYVENVEFKNFKVEVEKSAEEYYNEDDLDVISK